MFYMKDCYYYSKDPKEIKTRITLNFCELIQRYWYLQVEHTMTPSSILNWYKWTFIELTLDRGQFEVKDLKVLDPWAFRPNAWANTLAFQYFCFPHLLTCFEKRVIKISTSCLYVDLTSYFIQRRFFWYVIFDHVF